MDYVWFVMYLSRLNEEFCKEFDRIYFPFFPDFFSDHKQDKHRLHRIKKTMDLYNKYQPKVQEIKRFAYTATDHRVQRFFKSVTNNHTYEILFGKRVVMMHIDIGKTICNECPVCLNDEVNVCVITKCGHILCVDCVESIHNIGDINGTLNNRILNVSSKPCPMCRYAKPFNDIYIYDSTSGNVGADIYIKKEGEEYFNCTSSCCVS
jgi:hypothetical protein